MKFSWFGSSRRGCRVSSLEVFNVFGGGDDDEDVGVLVSQLRQPTVDYFIEIYSLCILVLFCEV